MGCKSSKPKQSEKILKIRPQEKDIKKTLEAKVVLLGDANVGKSSIAQRFCKNVFSNKHIATIGGAYLQQRVVLDNGEVMKLHLWDTGGAERFRSIANLYYKEAAVAILTYDVTNEQSLESLEYWIEELKTKADNDILLCLAGNKVDVPSNEIKVSHSKAKKFAQENKMIFYETSARLGTGVVELFTDIAKKLYEIKNSTNNKRYINIYYV